MERNGTHTTAVHVWRALRSSALVLLLTGTLLGQVGLNKLAQSTMNFLTVSVSPAASGMGDAYTTLSTGAESMFYNPAGLAEQSASITAIAGLTQWIADIDYLFGGVAMTVGGLGTFGASMVVVDYGTIIGTSLLGPGEQGLYPLGYKDNGPLSNVGAYAIGLSYSRQITPMFSIGGTVRYAAQQLGTSSFSPGESRENNAAKFVYDAGVRYHTGIRSFSFAMAIRHFASDVKREEIEETLPLTFVLGVAVDAIELIAGEPVDGHQFIVSADFLHQNYYSERANVGCAYTFGRVLTLRGGLQTNRDIASWSAGVGVSPDILDQKVRFDYSYSAFTYFKGVNRLSIGYDF